MMPEYENPYDFEKPVRHPGLFAGRTKELGEVEYYLGLSTSKRPSYYNLSLIGNRASGKTSFLNMIQHMAEKKDLLTVKISLNEQTSTNEVLLFKEIFDGIATAGAQKDMFGGLSGKVYRELRKVFDLLDIKAEIPFLFGTAYIGMKDGKSADNSISQQVLMHDLKEFFGEAKNKSIPSIVLLFDECDLLAKNHTLLQKLRNVFSELDGYILIFSGTEKMFPAMEEVFSPLPRFFKRINVENFIDINDTKDCLLKPLTEEEKKSFDHTSIAEIHYITNGSPYEINLIAHYMYRRWKEGKSKLIGLTSEILEDVLNEIERLRGSHYETVNKIKLYWKDQLKILIGLLEFPNVSAEWLSEYMLLDEIDTLQPKDSYVKKSITRDYVKDLERNGLIIEENKKIRFKGDSFDILYLKYFCASKGYIDLKEFRIGAPMDPLINFYHKFVEVMLLKDFQEYNVQAGFDKREKIEGKTSKKFVIGAKINLPPGEHTILTLSDETRNEFYLGAPNSIRFRVNVDWMKEGFVTQIKFKNEGDKNKFEDLLKILTNKLELLGYKIILKDENHWNVEGTEYSKQGNWHEAIKCYDKSIELDPLLELSWANKSQALFNLKKYDDALDCINKALELHQSWADAIILKGMILLNLQRNEETIQCLERANKINIEDWRAWDYKGRALLNLQKFEEAITSFNMAINLKNDNYDAILYRGVSLTGLKKYSEALSDFELILKTIPNNPMALFRKAVCLYELDKKDESKAAIDELERNNPDDLSMMELKSIILFAIGKHDEAIECCNKIIEKIPEQANAWYNRACFKARKGDIDSSIEDLKKSIELDKDGVTKLAKNEPDFTSLQNDERFIKNNLRLVRVFVSILKMA